MAGGDPGRHCAGCGRPLSRYNTGPRCQACISAAREATPARRGRASETLVDRARLAQLRRDHGWTQELLAGRAGVSTELVKKLEQGAKRSARLSTLGALARALNIPVGALLSGRSGGEPAAAPARPAEPDPAREPGRPTLLRALIAQRHWQSFRAFQAQFCRAARELAERERDPGLAKVTVSSRQWERWYSGNVKTEPYPDACRVLEHMFGYPVQQLLASAEQVSAGREVIDAIRNGASPGTIRAGHYGDNRAGTELLADQISELVNWAETTNVGDGTISYLDDAAMRLSRDCLTDPPAQSSAHKSRRRQR